MRYLFGFLCVCALGMMPLVGCTDDGGGGGTGGGGGCTSGWCGGSEPACEWIVCRDGNECTEDECTEPWGNCIYPAVEDGTACGNDAGTCQQGSCQVACTEQGIRNAIAAGDGPYTFDCADGTTMVTTADEIVIDNDVILDGEGNLTVDGNGDHRVFSTGAGVTAELDGLGVSGGRSSDGGGIYNDRATLTLTNSTVFGNTANSGGGIYNDHATLTLTNSTVSGNFTEGGCGEGVCGVGGIWNFSGTLTITNSTITGNDPPDVTNFGGSAGPNTATIVSSTLSSVALVNGTLTLAGSLVVDECDIYTLANTTSNGYNIESPGDTCGFDKVTDHFGVTAEQLALGPLQDNGGPTMTYALLPGSVAIDQIPIRECVLTSDQRGEPRPGGTLCDVGAFEVQP